MSNYPSGYGNGREYSEDDVLNAGGSLACGCTKESPCVTHREATP